MDYLVVPGHSSLNFGSSDLTIRARLRFQSHTNTYNMLLSWISGANFVQLTYKGVDQKWRFITNTWTEGSGNAIDSGVWIPSDDTWYYFVLIRSGNDWKYYIDNSLSATVTRSGSVTDTSSIDMQIGADATSGREFHGWIDELEIQVGNAISDFSVPGSALGLSANTSILHHYDGDDGQQWTIDQSTNQHVATFVNNAQLDTAQSVFGGSSLALNLSDFTTTNRGKYRFFNVS